ncbi:MAG: hypothetical protein FWC43_08815 [Planctomycetaceae bacterium]|nr:hypothetical protein [Planctomycetaceae bacterium]
MFRYYSEKSAPFHTKIKLLPWDFLMYVEEFEMLQSLLLKHSDECDNMEPMLNRLDEVVERASNLENKVVPFYQTFLVRVTKNNTLFTKTYQIDMLQRAQKYFDKHQRSDLTLQARAVIKRLEQEGKEHDKRYQDFLDTLD